MTEDDLDRSFAFFGSLTPEDRVYLRHDVTRREEVENRIRLMKEGRVKRLVALVGDKIIADAALELDPYRWKQHVAELRLIVANPYKRKGLGMLMARELYSSASEAKVEEIMVKMMRPQIAARRIFRRLGFHEEIVMPDYVKDRGGEVQDMILMRCDLASLWDKLEDYFTHSDWQRTR